MSEPPKSTAALRQALHDDVKECWIAALNAPTALNRRNYIRAVFAFVEGFVSVMKQHVVEEAQAGRFVPTPAERAMLLEETYELRDNGEPRSRPLFLQTLANVRFAFEVFARSHGATARPDYGTAGWQAFRDALEIRHRITHPNATDDVAISDTEFETVQKGHDWFLDSTFAVYTEGRARMMVELERVQKLAAGGDA